MKNATALYSFLVFLTFAFIACKDDSESREDEKIKEDTTMQVSQDSISTEIDDSPLIDNIAVEFKENTYSSGVQLNGKDVKYYNVEVQPDETYSVKLTGTDPYTNLLIFSPEGNVLYNKNTGDSLIHWEGSFETSGRATFHVSLESGHAEKEKQTEVQFTLNRNN